MVAMNARRRGTPLTIVTAGFAADERHGICYATVGGGARETLVRVEFACRPLPVLRGRDVAYYALDALAAELRRRPRNSRRGRGQMPAASGAARPRRRLLRARRTSRRIAPAGHCAR